VDRHQATLREQHGHVLHGFAVVPAAVSDDVEELSDWFARSDEWTATLRPTPKRT
jgi:hypothetical protein